MRALLIIALSFALGGCSLWTKSQLEGFEEAGCDLELQIRGFPHPGNPIIVRGVRATNTELVALAIVDDIDPLADSIEADLDFIMPNGFRGTDVRIDFFADIIEDRMSTSGDHTWSIDDPCGNAPNFFPHDGINLDVLRPPLITGNTFHMSVTGLAPTVLFELRVSEIVDPDDTSTHRTVGLYRARTPTSAGLVDVDVVLEGILVPGAEYFVEMWNDLDNDAVYDAPGAGDQSWALESPEEFIRDCDPIATPGCTDFTFPADTNSPSDVGRILITVPVP